jgi:hypothetical protein
MGLNSKYNLGFISQVEASMRGEVTFIPNPLARVGSVFNLMQSRYTLVSGATGSGKTSFVDYEFVLAPYTYLKGNKENIHWECAYFSLERKAMFKHAKWVSWLIYRDTGYMIPADDLMGWGSSPINATGYDLIRSYDAEISDILEKVHIYEGKSNTEVIRRVIDKKAAELGTLYKTDEIGMYVGSSPIPRVEFKDESLIEQTSTGPKPYIIGKHGDIEFKLYQNDHKYFLNNPKTFFFIVIDGINLLGDKDVVDAISLVLAEARDIYGFSPVVVTQQNRAMGDIQRVKLHGADLSPQIEDIFKSSQMGFDADLIVGLFDPLRYKAYDAEGSYEGYYIKSDSSKVISPSTQAPSGHSRFRSLHILKNSFGADGNKFGLKFLGECNHFETLPFPGTAEMDAAYANIRKGM